MELGLKGMLTEGMWNYAVKTYPQIKWGDVTKMTAALKELKLTKAIEDATGSLQNAPARLLIIQKVTRAARPRQIEIKTAEGVWLTQREDKFAYLRKIAMGMMKTDQTTQPITERAGEWIDQNRHKISTAPMNDISAKEIIETWKQLRNKETRGHDGISTKAWLSNGIAHTSKLMAEWVNTIMADRPTEERTSARIRHARMVLIPKQGKAGWQPLTLANMLLKIHDRKKLIGH